MNLHTYFLFVIIHSKRANQLVVLRASADGDAKTVLAKLNASAVSNYDALVDEVVVYCLSISDLCKEEVRSRWIYLLTLRQQGECLYDTMSLLKDCVHPEVHLLQVSNHLQRFLLREDVHVVWVFHLIKEIDDLL